MDTTTGLFRLCKECEPSGYCQAANVVAGLQAAAKEKGADLPALTKSIVYVQSNADERGCPNLKIIFQG